VLTCSTSRYRLLQKDGKLDDPSGDKIVEKIKDAGYNVTFRRIVPDEKDVIQHTVMKALKSRKVDIIIMCGGTGISPKDVTIEAIKPMLDKEIDGFGEIFRFISYQEIGSSALLSRALAGTCKGKVVFCIPGSPQSVALSLERLILPEAAHILKHTRE